MQISGAQLTRQHPRPRVRYPAGPARGSHFYHRPAQRQGSGRRAVHQAERGRVGARRRAHCGRVVLWSVSVLGCMCLQLTTQSSPIQHSTAKRGNAPHRYTSCSAPCRCCRRSCRSSCARLSRMWSGWRFRRSLILTLRGGLWARILRGRSSSELGMARKARVEWS